MVITLGKNGEWSSHYGSVAKERKIYVGKVTNYLSNLGVIEVKVEASDFKDDKC